MHFRDLLNNGVQVLDEASFNKGNLVKVATILSKIMGRKLGGSFNPIGIEAYSRKSGKGHGYRVMNNSGIMLRFNWDDRIGKKSSSELTSIDYWSEQNKDFQRPTRTVVLGPSVNIVQVVDKITTALLTGNINEGYTGNLDEAPSIKAKEDWLKQRGLPVSASKSSKVMSRIASERGFAEELEVFMGQSETNSFEADLRKEEKTFSKEVFANPDTVFEDIEDLLSVVARKEWRTLVVCGMGGVGKTFHITEGPRGLKSLLGNEGDKWTYHSGTKAAPFSFYQTLFRERDKIIVFDEADSLLKNPDIVMMLKPILDTSGDNMAEYMSGTMNMVGKSHAEIEEYSREVDNSLNAGAVIGNKEKDGVVVLPSKFKFTGGMIFISNMKAEQIEGAIMSRSIFVDVHLAQQDVVKRIQSIAMAKRKSDGLEEDDVLEIMEALSMGSSAKGPKNEITYMTPEYARQTKQLTVRAYQLAVILKKSGLARWSELSQMYA